MKKLLPLLGCLLLLFAACKKEDSGPQLTPGAVPLTRVLINGMPAQADESGSIYTVLLPGQTDFTSMRIRLLTDAPIIQLNGNTVGKSIPEVDMSQPCSLRLIQNGTYQDYRLIARNTGLPIVHIDTPNKKKIDSKEYWMEGAAVRIEYPNGRVDYEGTTSIRGRGNSTWLWYPKKPYALKLDEKGSLLGMPAHKRWVLLANWKDRTLMRNDAAFWLSRQTGLSYTVRGHHVELVLNGTHVGNYYLCEQIKIGKHRVNVEKMDSQESDPTRITGGYLLEIDTYLDEKYQFKSPRFNLPWMVKEPEDDELSAAAFNYIKSWILELESLLKDTQRVRNHEYEAYLDVDSAIDYMLVEELTTNHDFYNEWPWPGPHSAYLYKDRDGKLFHGPVWDFDYHVFCPQFTHQWTGATRTMLYPALLKDPQFCDRMVERWEMQKEQLKRLPEYIDAQAEKIRLSDQVNQELWPISNRENGDETMSFQQSIDRIKKSFLDKWTWMDAHIRELGR